MWWFKSKVPNKNGNGLPTVMTESWFIQKTAQDLQFFLGAQHLEWGDTVPRGSSHGTPWVLGKAAGIYTHRSTRKNKWKKTPPMALPLLNFECQYSAGPPFEGLGHLGTKSSSEIGHFRNLAESSSHYREVGLVSVVIIFSPSNPQTLFAITLSFNLSSFTSVYLFNGTFIHIPFLTNR